MSAVREAVVDGLFYPAAPGALRAQIVEYLAEVGAADDTGRAPKLLITPHAGYEYCGALLAARRHGLAPRILDLRNSGDTAGDRDRVVGYAAIAFMEPLVQ